MAYRKKIALSSSTAVSSLRSTGSIFTNLVFSTILESLFAFLNSELFVSIFVDKCSDSEESISVFVDKCSDEKLASPSYSSLFSILIPPLKSSSWPFRDCCC